MFSARVIASCVLSCWLGAAWAQGTPPAKPAKPAPAASAPAAAASAAGPRAPTENTAELDEVSRLMRAGKMQEALVLADAVVQSYEDRYRRGKVQVFASRSPAEAQAYLNEVGRTPSPGKQAMEAGVYPSTWGDAYYLKSFILTEMRRFPDARKAIEAAVALAPHNAAYRAELGQLLLKEKNWDEAAKEFKRAEADAREFSPPSVRGRELARALRGQAFVLVEEKDLDGAEKLYNECLKIDANDPVAKAELRYIAQKRGHKPSSAAATK
ncbi:MAG TPA: tetratricopeptide repeat protein [Ramlibacter sp.]|uniref:tetratricopeptide repeat protein n=1 Tax=Ramlibacter sp. TaxID=1917967 RepID=UPI002D80496C|nr:tetratricopeptide repeat protein [Ramlibacter sp.]HET8744853.1 tetratricopeptide repeat protein [Ramlibacter sp.]